MITKQIDLIRFVTPPLQRGLIAKSSEVSKGIKPMIVT